MWSPRTLLLLAILVGATALTAACGAGASSAPAATSATSSADPASSVTPAGSVPPNTRQAAQLLNEWTACMRGHGDPGQVTPTIDSYDVIHVAMALTVSGGWQGSSGQGGTGGPGSHCLTYMDAAERALGGGPGTVMGLPGQAALQQYVACMRANGVPDYTVPLGPVGSSSNSAAYVNATAACFNQTHTHVPGGIGPPGSVNVNNLGWVAGA
jgi:hypothetical protein